MTGIPQQLPSHLVEEAQEDETKFHFRKHKKRGKNQVSLRTKILAKKQQQRNKGYETRPDTRYTGRRRPSRF